MISYTEYYKNHYSIQIKDLKQPMLVSMKERKIDGKEAEPLKFCLVPELAFLTGYTDEMRADNQVGHAMISYKLSNYYPIIIQLLFNYYPICNNLKKKTLSIWFFFDKYDKYFRFLQPF